MTEKVMVGMSGGVDSSVCAVLLMEQGYNTCGVTLQLFNNNNALQDELTRTCSSLDDVKDAKKVCEKLGIEHYVFDFTNEFKENVIKKFALSYEKGETPNPCIFCNGSIKFGKLLEQAQSMGKDKIATGHYVQSEYDSVSKRYLLKKALDNTKDQTYVLYMLSQLELSKIIFPLGGYKKSDARIIAEKSNLINARKPDSQDICFIKDGDYAKFLEEQMGIKTPKGNFVYKDGTVLGEHKGIIHYTIGQRKGLGISYKHPIFVIDKEKESNIVKLGESIDLFSKRLTANNVNYIAIEKLNGDMNVKAKTRYSQKEANAKIHPISEDRVVVEFEENQRAITKGQSVVFYDNDIVVGGGIIE